MPEPVVADLVKAARQDVLEKAPEELDTRQPLDVPRVSLAIFPTEGHMSFVHAENSCIGNRRAEDRPRQIAQDRVVTLAVMLAEGDVVSSGRRYNFGSPVGAGPAVAE